MAGKYVFIVNPGPKGPVQAVTNDSAIVTDAMMMQILAKRATAWTSASAMTASA